MTGPTLRKRFRLAEIANRANRLNSLTNRERQITITTTLECAMQEARIELLQRMPIFGGIRTETLQFLLPSCPIVSVPTDEFFFRELDQGDSMYVLEMGKAAVSKSWRGQ